LRYLTTAEQLGVTDDDKGLELFWPEKIGIKTADLLSGYRLGGDYNYVCLAPGAGFFTKRWPPEYYRQLICLIKAHLNLKIVILGGSGDTAIGEQLSHSDDVFNFCGKWNLLECAVIMSKGLAVVSNDTGLMHIATAVQKPVVAIFGSSVVEWGFAPFRSEHILVEQSNLICRPCSHIGRHECPQKHFRCMMEISPARVFEALQSLLEK
jgi:heptosyltransferase-2